MNLLIDKLIIFIFCIAFYIPNVSYTQRIVPILIAATISAISSYFDNDGIKLVGFIIYIFICIINPMFLFFIPLICYDILIFKVKYIWMLALFPIIYNLKQTLSIQAILTALLIVIAYLLKYRTVSLQNIKKEYFKLQDKGKEMSMMFEMKNKELMEKQDYEINLAMLNERNRIARDIHDNVGHMLSSSILQLGALLTVNKDNKTKESLELVKDTLTKAMDSIRNSVHDLHEESIELHTEIQTLIDNFKFCPVHLDYDIDSNPEKSLKYCFITITKEALSNILKHSNATKASIILREHPALYQMIIQDNGTDIKYSSNNGIGLKNISDRVAAFNGNLNISTDNGFRVFISIPRN